MTSILSSYYLDEPLNDSELQFVWQTLVGPWAKFKTGASSIVQKRVPGVLPVPDSNGNYRHDREHRAVIVRGNLRHADIISDAGQQVIWVMPKDAEWDAIFQFAIRLETGFGPFVVQRWFKDKNVLVRGEIRVVDTHRLLQGL